MTLDELFALGVSCSVGHLDFKGQHIGSVTVDGLVLTPEGEELVRDSKLAPAVEAEVAPAVKAGKKSKAKAAPSDVPADDEDLWGSLDKEIGA